MPTLAAHTPIGTLIDQLRALRVQVGVYVMTPGTAVYQCTKSEHDGNAAGVADLYPVDDAGEQHLGICLPCAVEVVLAEDIRRVEIKRIAGPTVVEAWPMARTSDMVIAEPDVCGPLCEMPREVFEQHYDGLGWHLYAGATVQPAPAAEPAAPAKVTVLDRDGRLVTVETVGVEVEIAELGRNVLALDLSTPAGLAAARVIRATLDAAIAQAA